MSTALVKQGESNLSKIPWRNALSRQRVRNPAHFPRYPSERALYGVDRDYERWVLIPNSGKLVCVKDIYIEVGPRMDIKAGTERHLPYACVTDIPVPIPNLPKFHERGASLHPSDMGDRLLGVPVLLVRNNI